MRKLKVNKLKKQQLLPQLLLIINCKMTREIARKYFGLRPLFNNTMLKQEEDLSNRINKGSTLKTNKTEQSNDNIQTDYKAITADKRQITRTHSHRGIVKLAPRKGRSLAPPSPKDLKDLFLFENRRSGLRQIWGSLQ